MTTDRIVQDDESVLAIIAHSANNGSAPAMLSAQLWTTTGERQNFGPVDIAATGIFTDAQPGDRFRIVRATEEWA